MGNRIASGNNTLTISSLQKKLPRPVHGLLFLLLCWTLLRGLLLYCAWGIAPDPQFKQQVLTHFSEAEIQAGLDYVRAYRNVSIVSGFITIWLLFGIYLSGGFDKLYQRLRILSGGGYWRTGILFNLILMTILTLVSLPFSIWRHSIEFAQGFTRTGWLEWSRLLLTSFGIQVLLSTITLLAVFTVIRRLPRFWPLAVACVTSLLSILVIICSPYLITPLYYNQTKVPDGELKQRIQQIATTAGIPVEDIYQIDASRYTKHTNAYFTGLFGKRRIVLYDTLIASHTVDEAAMIFAHEAGHWQHDHMRYGMTATFLGILFTCLLIQWVFPWAASDHRLNLGTIDDFRNLPLLVVLGLILPLLVAPIPAQISQAMERQSDWASLELTGQPEVYISAEKRLALDNKSNLLPHPFRVFWLYSHPPTIDRIEMAGKWMAQHGKTKPAETTPPAAND